MNNSRSEIDESSFDAEELFNSFGGHYSAPSTAGQERQAPERPPVRPAPAEQPEPYTSPAPQPRKEIAAEPEAAPEAKFEAAEAKAEDAVEDAAAQLPEGYSTLRKLSIFTGIVLFFLMAYILIVTISYFATIAHDQSALLAGETDPSAFTNAGGTAGAWISHTLLYEWLGVGGFILIYYMGAISMRLLGVIRFSVWNFTFKCLLTAIAVSIISGFLVEATGAHTQFFWGGRHGYLVNERLTRFAGIWGALAVSAIMAGLLVVLFIDSISKVTHWIGGRMEQVVERRRRERLEREQYEARTRAEHEAEAEAVVDEPEESEESDVSDKSDKSDKSDESDRSDQSDPSAASESSGPFDEPLFGGEGEPGESGAEENYSLFADGDDTTSESQQEPAQATATETQMVVEKPLIETCDPAEHAPAASPEGQAAGDLFDPTAELSHYRFPTLDLLKDVAYNADSVDETEMEENKNRIIKTLSDYGIPIQHIHATVGPTVTLYEIIPAEGVRIAKIKRLEDDIALSVAALGIRIIAPIPGKGTIGIEVPNKDPQVVSIRSILSSRKFQESNMELPMAIGCTISNEVFMADLTKMPHLLVAGATGMGKSVGLNTIIASLLYKKHPSQLKFVLIDPKMVEFSLYSSLENHYLAKLPGEDDAIITDPSKVVATLNSLCIEMDNRYALLKMASCRNIKEYNDRFVRRTLNPEKGHHYLPYIVVVVDEFADLIMTAGKEIETPIARIAQKARAVGIHMILATQRPSVQVITGPIKANFPGRIAFRVFQMVDSRTILDCPGANQLIGRGDMLFSNNGKIDRVQCAFIDTPEVQAICEAIGSQPGYGCAYPLPEYVPDSDSQGSLGGSPSDRDPLFGDAARYVVQTDTASTSSLQRRYSIGYNRAGKIMDQLEAAGIVGPSQGGKPRQVLMDPMQLGHYLGDE